MKKIYNGAKFAAVALASLLVVLGVHGMDFGWEDQTLFGQAPLLQAAEDAHTRLAGQEAVRASLAAGTHMPAAGVRTQKQLDEQLLQAAREGNALPVRRLLDAGANPNVANAEGLKPLHIAANEGHTAVVTALLEGGADVNAAEPLGWTPLYFAAHGGHAAVVSRLLDEGVDQNAGFLADKPLHIAAQRGGMAVVRELLDRRAHLDRPGQGGRTPLHGAAQGGHPAVVKELLERGADANREAAGSFRESHCMLLQRWDMQTLSGSYLRPVQIRML